MDAAVLDSEIARQQAILDALPILADVMRSDVLFYDHIAPDQLEVMYHAQPHSIASLYADNCKGELRPLVKASVLAKAIKHGLRGHGTLDLVGDGAAPVHQEVLPVRDTMGGIIGALSIETSQIAHVSYRNRGSAYHRAITLFTEMVARGELQGAQPFSPFTNQDGVVIVGRDLRLRYVSNLAESFYRQLGITEKLVGRRVDSLETGDEQLVWRAFQERIGVEQEEPVRDRIWVRKAIPLIPNSPGRHRQQRWLTLAGALPSPTQVLLLIHDATLDRQKEQDQIRLEAMIREIHHRVKNNLQTIISLARFQVRRAQTPETRQALADFSNRVFAVAQVHEFLAADGLAAIQLKEVCRQIAARVRESLIPPDSRISIEVEGDTVRLSARQATACALIVNELVQNAVEHAFEPESAGYIRIRLEDGADRVWISVVDNGRGVPEGFDWQHTDSLGLKIVRTLAQDLHAEVGLTNQTRPAHGLIARIAFSKISSGG